ncbi:MAG: DEAD/DEAH box helicase family protein [bacterium]|nr:DEAD/DEAH box helicase family protein [bacterium]
MARSIISYDKDLPEIPGRCPWEKPSSFLVKDPDSPTGWSVDEAGRRPSDRLLTTKLRMAVDAWRTGDPGNGIEPYAGASDVTKRLFAYWFEEDHEVSGFSVPFRYHFCQREAIETLVYLIEVVNNRDAKPLIDQFAQVFKKDLFESNIVHETTIDGKRRIRRYFPELDAEGVQDLPPEDLRRYAFKMATGSGKTWVMAMLIVWSHFHKQRVPGSDLSTNFLIVAPNVIVYQRLEKDFAGNEIFNRLPLVPPEWRPWNQKVILRGESLEPDASCNLFVNNIHQLYESREREWSPENAVDALLGRKPTKDLSSYQRSMLARVKELPDLVVMNDEAHHVHDEDLAWNQSLLNIHGAMNSGLSLWLDFSATPKDQNGMYYLWTIVDYPLAQAVEDRIVKAPIIVTKEDDPDQPTQDPEHVTRDNVTEKYGYWIHAAVARWKEHYETYRKLGTKPVLFIMSEKSMYADAIGEYLLQTPEFGFKKSEVLVIHTDTAGKITKKDLEKARTAARDIDKKTSKIKAISSVMMLREGWDVRNVSVVLGLRPFTAKAEILPEQVIGRGLRLMTEIGPDTQTLEVLGTRNLLNVLRDQLEAEGVGVGTTKGNPTKPVIIEPVQEKIAFDITIPITKPRLTHNVRNLSSLDPSQFEPIFDQEELEETFRLNLKMEFGITETEVHQTDIAAGFIPFSQELLSSITNKVIQYAKLQNVFAKLYPLVREYVATQCFGRTVAVDDESIRSHLHRLEIREGIAKYLARKIGELTIEKREIEFEKIAHKLSEMKPFRWRRNLPPLEAQRTLFNYVATYNNFERSFAEFLDKAEDVVRFAALGTTEQGKSGSQFRVDYLKPSGAIGFYYPDWVVVQKQGETEIKWIIETKGRVWEGTETKDAAMRDWCERIFPQTGEQWNYARVNQQRFESQNPKTLEEAVRMEN